MIIKINNNQQVVSTLSGDFGVKVDNIISFEVESVPAEEAGKLLYFNPDTLEFYYKDAPEVDREALKARMEAAQKRRTAESTKEHCLKWLADNDWKVNKRMLGEWAEDDERWIQYLTERRLIRAEYDAAVAQLEG